MFYDIHFDTLAALGHETNGRMDVAEFVGKGRTKRTVLTHNDAGNRHCHKLIIIDEKNNSHKNKIEKLVLHARFASWTQNRIFFLVLFWQMAILIMLLYLFLCLIFFGVFFVVVVLFILFGLI